MIMTDTNITNELALNDKQLNMVVELESKRDSPMTAGMPASWRKYCRTIVGDKFGACAT